MTAVLVLSVCLYLPGRLLAPALARKGDGWGERALLSVAGSAAVACPVLVALALLGRFTLPAIAACLLACAALCWAVGFKSGTAERARRGRWDVAVVALLAGSLALYMRPAEYVVNTRDPGVYLLFAAKLARTGELLSDDVLVRAVQGFHPFVGAIKYPGFYIGEAGMIVPQFFPGTFGFLGLGALAGGTWGTLYVVPLFGALSVLVTFALGSEVFGRWAGLLGAASLAASYAQIWWSRHPSSEVLTQFFVLSGLWLAARFARRSDPTTGVLAGMLLGGAMLIRPDAFLASVMLPMMFGYDLLVRRNARRWLLPGVPLVIFAGAGLLYVNTIGGRYLYLAYERHGVDGLLRLAPYLLATAVVLAAGLFAVRRGWGKRLGSWLDAHGGQVAVVGASGVVCVVLWGYFWAPAPLESLPEGSRDFDAYRSWILVRLSWFVTPFVGTLALLGLLLAARQPDRPRLMLLGALLAFGLLYTLIPNVSPDLPWATRRFVPAVFPAVCLLAGYGTVEAGRLLARVVGRRGGVAAAGTLSVLALAWTAQVALKMPADGELSGAVAAFERVEETLPEARVVFVEAPDGFDPGASTLEYLYGRPVLPYDRWRFWQESDDLGEAGLLDDAIYVKTDGGPAPLVSGLEFREVGRESFALPRLAPSETSFPEETQRPRMDYRVFRVETEER